MVGEMVAVVVTLRFTIGIGVVVALVMCSIVFPVTIAVERTVALARTAVAAATG